ncbi:hypothetical protein Pen02_33490 [Plantactinospora endophytica]|uniref:Uncharacterized protein n=1 Tax=Plantactinospora endophytica TaxID=673535 RepID=A0ABQ4E152_9ACTN|nr:hypothetical protein Pen02_33490 [Plantactinospora endophytica]
MIPPLATAATTAAEVQLAGVPLPTTRVGLAVSTARASAGTLARPFGLPGRGSAGTGLVEADGLAVGDGLAGAVGDPLAAPLASAAGAHCGPADGSAGGEPQPARPAAATSTVAINPAVILVCTGRS